MTFEEGVALLFHKLGDSKIMALGSSVNDYVMVRNVSCLFYDGKIYFKTDKNFRKTQQLSKPAGGTLHRWRSGRGNRRKQGACRGRAGKKV